MADRCWVDGCRRKVAWPSDMCDAHRMEAVVGMSVAQSLWRERRQEIRDAHKTLGIKVHLESMRESWQKKLRARETLSPGDREMFEWAIEASEAVAATLREYTAADDENPWIDEERYFQQLEGLAARLETEWGAFLASIAARYPADGSTATEEAPARAEPEPARGESAVSSGGEGWSPRSWQIDHLHDLEVPGERVAMKLSAPILEQFLIDLFVVCEVEDRPAQVVSRGMYIEAQAETVPGLEIRLPDLVATGMPLAAILEEAVVSAIPHLNEKVAAERAEATRKAFDDVRAAFAARPFDLRAHDKLCYAVRRLRDALAADPEAWGDPIEEICEAFPQVDEDEVGKMIAKAEWAQAETEKFLERLNESMSKSKSSESGEG